MERIFIFDGKNEQLVAVAGGSNEGTMPVTSAPFTEQLNKDFTLEVSVPANHTDAQYVVEGNIVGYLDLDGNLQAFNIFKVEDVHNGDTLQRVAYAEHVFYELLDDVVEDQRAYDVTADVALGKALSASRWQVGTVASLGTGNTNFYYNNALNNVREIVNTYGGELNFRLTYDNGAITGRYVDLLARRGADTGKRFEYTKDIDTIKRTVDATDIKTALYGRGKSSEIDATGGYTRKADFADIVWATPNNPVNKPQGQEWVGDPNAQVLYGRVGDYVNLGTMFFDTGYDTYHTGQSYNFTVSAGWTTDWDSINAVVGDEITNNNVINKPVFEITAIDGYNLTVKALTSITDGSPAQWSGEYVVRRNKRHRFGVVEFSEIEDPTALLQATWDYLQTVNKPRLTYEISAIDLERVSGLDHEKVRLGDTVFIIDRDLNLTVEARVIELKRDAVDPTVSTVVLGNFIPLFVDIAVKLDDVNKKLSEKEGIWDNATAPITDGDIAIEAPATPTNATASGLFETINVKWDFDPSIKVAGYELYASQVNNFTADASNIVWRGKAGGANLTVEPNQTWYFRVLAFNANGDKSALTGQFSATTAKITGTYIADATIGNAHIKDVSADKLTAGTIDANTIDVVNINVDNVTAGVLKAQYVQIGSQTTFQTGYDPTKKLQTVFQTTAPTDKNVIWVDTTDSSNVLWKVWDSGLNDWRIGPSGPRGPQGLQGLQGPKGDQGIQGPAGADGTPSFTHIAYATSADGTQGFSTSDSTNKTYIGIYVDSTATDSTDPTKYAWTLIKGQDGAQGIQGPAGADGQTPYLHIAYATNATGTAGFSVSDPTNKTYIGTYTDYTSADSTDPTKYTWALFQGPQGQQGPQGVQGPKGADGSSLYTWVKYADDASGGGMSDTPTGKLYIGLAYNKTTATESTTATDYTWSLIKGDAGPQGPAGDDGITTYTWIKYADDANGAGLSDDPTGKRYLGLAYNKTTATESTNPADYSFSPLYDNVVVGGVNLVTGTKDGSGWTGGLGINGNEFSMTNSSTTAENYFYSTYFGLEGGVEVTLSFEYKTTANVKSMEVYALPDDYSTTGLVNKQLTLSADWVSYSVTFTTPAGWGTADAPDQVRLRFDNNGSTDGTASTIYVRKVKLERGNVATDWSVAPADIDNAIGDAMETVTTEYTTAISNSKDDITLEVSKTLYGDSSDPNDTGGLKGDMMSYTDTQVKTTADGLTVKITNLTTTTDDHEDKLAEVYSYFKFEATGLNIGKSDSPLQINISNEQMDFIDNGNTVAYVNGQKMYIDTAEILSSIIVGNHKIEKYNNNITLVKWVGQ